MRRLFIPTLCFALACAGGAAEQPDDARIVPEALDVSALAGGNGVLQVTALTLLERAGQLELYAALRNDGEVAACSAALAVELFDRDAQSIGAGISGLLGRGSYRVAGAPGALASCIAPGAVAMTAIADLPSGIAVNDVASVVYRCPYFALEVEAIDGLELRDIEHVPDGAEIAFQGTLVNGLDVAVSRPSVSIFPLNRVGRPLGVATGSDELAIPPGGRWSFETSPVETPGASYAAYAAAAVAD